MVSGAEVKEWGERWEKCRLCFLEAVSRQSLGCKVFLRDQCL